MKQVYRSYSDSGHGWLAVPLKDIYKLGIENAISNYSYVKGKTVYLEEDCDATCFIVSYKKIMGYEPALAKNVNTNNRSRIRSYNSYRKPVNMLMFDVNSLGNYLKSIGQ